MPLSAQLLYQKQRSKPVPLLVPVNPPALPSDTELSLSQSIPYLLPFVSGALTKQCSIVLFSAPPAIPPTLSLP